MICKNCGTINADGSKFCQGCGQKLEEQNTVGANTAGNRSGNPVSNNTPKKKSILPFILIGVGALFILFIIFVIVIVLVLTAKPKINLDDYLTFTETGYDGYGTLAPSIDWEQLKQDYGEKLEPSAREAKNSTLLAVTSPIDAMKLSINVALSDNENLSNGDEITYHWTIPMSVLSPIKCKFIYEDSTYTMSQLREVQTFDPFSEVEIAFSGISPNGLIELTDCPLDNGLIYSFNKYDSLKNGDTVTVTAAFSQFENEQAFVRETGKKPSSMSKNFTVSGLDEYIQSYDKLTEDFLKKLKDDGMDSVYSYIAKAYDSESSLTGLEYCGYIFTGAKSDSLSSDIYNRLYLIYKGTVSDSEQKFSTTKVYYPVNYVNILSSKDGLSVTQESEIYGSCYFDDNSHKTKGFTNPILLYHDIFSLFRDEYECISGDGFEQYDHYESITKMEDINDICKEFMYSDSNDRVLSYLANAYSKDYTISEPELLGEYLLIEKEQGIDFANHNIVYIVYHLKVSLKKSGAFFTDVYLPVKYAGIVNLPNNDYLISAMNGIVDRSDFPSPKSFNTTRGYIDGTVMYTKLVTANRDKYTYTVSDGLKDFGE